MQKKWVFEKKRFFGHKFEPQTLDGQSSAFKVRILA